MATAVATLFSAPTALASTLSSGGQLKAGTGEQNVISITQSGSVTTITDSAGVTFAVGQDCTQNSGTQITCTGFSSFGVDAGDLNDQVTLTLPAVQRVTVSGGDGNDVIDGSGVGAAGPVQNGFDGCSGNDTITGSPGKDGIDQGQGGCASADPFAALTAATAGDDRLVGGAGDDVIGAVVGADTVDAGEGNDDVNTINVAPPPTGGPVPDGAVDTIICGGGTDDAEAGQGDLLDMDCESVLQFITCPEGAADCLGAATVTAPGGAASSSLASAAGGKKKGKRTVLGKSQKVKLKAGQYRGVSIKLRPKKVKSALGKRSQVGATFQANLTKVRKGKTIGHVKKKVRFKLTR
jgi:hypothetical protein